MACCQNCAEGTGPCEDEEMPFDAKNPFALARAPRAVSRPLARRAAPGKLGKLSDPMVAGVSVSQAAGVAAGGWGGWALAAMAFGKKNTAAKVISALAGAYLGYEVVPAVTDATGL